MSTSTTMIPHKLYDSNLGKVLVYPRYQLTRYTVDDHGNPSVVVGWYKPFSTILGIPLPMYTENKPDLVVYQLDDGSLLAATKAVIEDSKQTYSSEWHSMAYETQVDKLISLADLPAAL